MEKRDSWEEVAARCRKDLERFKPASERIRVFVGFDVQPAFWSDCSHAETPEEALKMAKREDREAQRMRRGKNPCETNRESLMSERERQRDFGQHLENLSREDRYFVLPMMVKAVRIEHIGPIREFSAKFSKGVNIVYGPNGCGKTVLVKTLYDFLHSQRGKLRYDLTHGESEGWISVQAYWSKTAFEYAEIRSADASWTPDAKRCALLDEPANVLANDDFKQFLDYLWKLGFAQVIMTTCNIDRCSLGEGKLLKMRALVDSLMH